MFTATTALRHKHSSTCSSSLLYHETLPQNKARCMTGKLRWGQAGYDCASEVTTILCIAVRLLPHDEALTRIHDNTFMLIRLEIDVLITGCEASLWIGEQFASDLQALLPSLRVVAMSANKIIGVCRSIPSHGIVSKFIRTPLQA